MGKDVTNHVTLRQLKNVTYPVIPNCNIYCNNYGMKNALRNVRKILKLNQDDFAELINKSRVHVSRMENSSTPLSFKQVNEIMGHIEREYGKEKITRDDFFEDEETSDIKKNAEKIAKMMKQMSDTDQIKFMHMAELFLENPKLK